MTPPVPNSPAPVDPQVLQQLQPAQNASQFQAPPQAQREATATDIIKRYETNLKSLTDKQIREAIDREKLFQYAMVRRNDFYYRGNQHLVPTYIGTGDVIDYKPVNNQMLLKSSNPNVTNSTIYDYVINHFRGDTRKFVGVLGQKSPNVKARPAWERDESGNRRSAIANDCAMYLRQQWDAEAANRYLVLSLAKNGTTFIHTPWVADAERYGTHEEPIWGAQEQKIEPDGFQCKFCGTLTPGNPQMMPPQCSNPACRMPLGPEDFREGATEQVPGIIGSKTYANGSVELHIHSAYDVTTPFYIKDLEHCPWLWVDFEEDAAVLASRYPNRGLEEDLESDRTSTDAGGGTASSLGRLARNQASSATGYFMFERQNRWRYSRFWLRPNMYAYLAKTGLQGNDAKTAIQEFQQKFPRGLKLTFANNHLVDVEHERLDEVWAAVKPETSEYIYADPIFNDYIQGADIMNDAWNINLQLLETSIPATIYDPNVLDPKKIRGGFQPNEFIPAIQGAGARFTEAFFRIPTSDPKPEIVNFQKVVVDSLREIVGLLPAIWGGDDNVQTAEQARRRLNQALMVLATTWNEIRNGWAKAYRNGTRQLARYSLGRLVSSQGDAESVTVKEIGDLAELLLGGWDFECDQAIPMNWTQLRDFVQSIFTMAPEMAHLLGMDNPDNLDKINEGIGVPGWDLPQLKERNRIRDLIGRLLQSGPIQGPQGLMPSIALDFQVTWNPQLMVSTIHDWLMGEDGRSAEGQPGYDNVVAAGLAALQAMAPPPAPPPTGPGAGPNQGANPKALGGPTPAPGDPSEGLPGPLQNGQPPAAPEAPLPPLNPPAGGMNLNAAPMVVQ